MLASVVKHAASIESADTPRGIQALLIPDMAGTHAKPSPLMALPPELRNHIYEYTMINDVEIFAETVRLPSLLYVSQQISQEYAGMFYDTNLIKLDAYYSGTDSWCQITDRLAKQRTLQQSSFADLFDFWSLASARRYCQRICYNRENVRRGIVTVWTNAGFRRWQWNVKS